MIKDRKQRWNQKTISIFVLLIFFPIFFHIQGNGFVDNLFCDQKSNLSTSQPKIDTESHVPSPLILEKTNNPLNVQKSGEYTYHDLSLSMNFLEHAPIVIYGNQDLIAQASNENWSGIGTREDPYIIEGLNITVSGIPAPAIEIKNTNLYFSIRNCFIKDGNSGIFFDYVRNGQIVNNTITNTIGGNNERTGIAFSYSNNIIVTNNTLFNHEFAFETVVSSSNIIHNNSFYENINGILGRGDNNVFSNNLFSQNNLALDIKQSNNNTISGNYILNNYEDGIYLDSTFGTRIISNIIYKNSWRGIAASSSNNNVIMNNSLRENGGYGVIIEENSNENLISKNNFENNNPLGWKQALDDGVNSCFLQNCWSDWLIPDSDSDGIVDSPYFLEGNANNNDTFPLTTIEYVYMNISKILTQNILYPIKDTILNGTVNLLWTVTVGPYHIETEYINLIYDIQYDIYFSSDGGKNWLLIVDNLTTNQYLWNTTSIPDGSNYLIKILTSNTNGYAIETISDSFSIRNSESASNEVFVQLLSILLMVFCISAIGYYIVNNKLINPSFTEFFQSDQIEFFKPLYHKVVVGLENIKTSMISGFVTTPLLEPFETIEQLDPVETTSLINYFPSDFQETLKSIKGRTALVLIEMAYQDLLETNPTKISQSLNIPPTTVSDEIKRLITLDFIESDVQPSLLQDARYKYYKITSKGFIFLSSLKGALEFSINRLRSKKTEGWT
ncbi:MAG: NosD domain-containing protein [Candidatus Hodarchaeales archaeon]|jgi:parallel beta-helix repeat protein